MNRAQQLLLLAVRIYQRLISPMLGGLLGPNGCRFEPSCSHYAAQAVTEHGAMRGALLATRRLCRCHPWGGCGIDPVPRKAEAGEKYLEAKFPALTS